MSEYDARADSRDNYDLYLAEMRKRKAAKRIEQIGDATLLLGDCLEILPTLGKVDAVVTDPPYGMKWDGKVSVGKNGHGATGAKAKHYGVSIHGDDQPFDAAPWLQYKNVLLWGFNHFPEQLRRGRALVWIKRSDEGFGSFLSDAEIAWCSAGHGVYCFRDQSLMGETNQRAHPTQKPVPLMRWCVEQFPGAHTILDPFMGSGTTGVACAKLGRKFIGIEIEPRYFDIACKRIEEAYKQPDMFIEPPAKPKQEAML
jgi:site-specific DNA-methyltransferase (adenine-specific)